MNVVPKLGRSVRGCKNITNLHSLPKQYYGYCYHVVFLCTLYFCAACIYLWLWLMCVFAAWTTKTALISTQVSDVLYLFCLLCSVVYFCENCNC